MCDCIETVNAKLAERNTRLHEPIFVFGPDPGRRLFIETERIERGRGKKPKVSMFATFCPFCGEKYPEGEVTPLKPVEPDEPVRVVYEPDPEWRNKSRDHPPRKMTPEEARHAQFMGGVGDEVWD